MDDAALLNAQARTRAPPGRDAKERPVGIVWRTVDGLDGAHGTECDHTGAAGSVPC
jgi:hypothetical protein